MSIFEEAAKQTGRVEAREPGQEQIWVRAAREGDPAAFNRLVLKWERKIYNLTLRQLGDREDAAEVTQEVFLAAYRGLDGFRSGARFSTWLFRIAVNRCITRLRRKPPAAASLDEDPAEGRKVEPSIGEDQDRTVFEQERRWRIRRALEGLGPQERLVVELKTFQDETFASISDLLGLPESTVKSKYYVALDRLKRGLRDLENPL